MQALFLLTKCPARLKTLSAGTDEAFTWLSDQDIGVSHARSQVLFTRMASNMQRDKAKTLSFASSFACSCNNGR